MEYLVFVTQDADEARDVVQTLNAAGIGEDAISVIAKENTQLEDLPTSAPEHESDVLPAFARGVATGGATGLLAGLAALAFPPAGIVIGGGAVLAATLGGASFGAFASALVGTSVPNSQLRDYEDQVQAGKILMVVSLEDKERIGEVRRLLESEHRTIDEFGTKDAPPII